MRAAARAIVIENDEILVMQRDKGGARYFTLVGGRVNDGETLEQAVQREVMEETGLTITTARLVFVEKHPAPYNEQYTYLCEVAPHEAIGVRLGSEEDTLNKMGANIHTPYWVPVRVFDRLQFRTPQLQQAVTEALRRGFPAEARYL